MANFKHICKLHRECISFEFMKKVYNDKLTYQSITNFNELCDYDRKYISNIYRYHPDRPACSLYSNYDKENNAIKYLTRLNAYKFYTTLFQSSREIKVDTDFINQRAYVAGYIPKNIGEKLFDKLKNNKRLYIEIISTSSTCNLNNINVITAHNNSNLLIEYEKSEFNSIPSDINMNASYKKFYQELEIKTNVKDNINAEIISKINGQPLFYSSFTDKEYRACFLNKNNKFFNMEYKSSDWYDDPVNAILENETYKIIICDKEWNNNDEYLWRIVLRHLINMQD